MNSVGFFFCYLTPQRMHPIKIKISHKRKILIDPNYNYKRL